MVETAKKQLSDLHILNVSFLQNSQEKLHCIEMFAAPYTNKLLERKVSLSLSLTRSMEGDRIEWPSLVLAPCGNEEGRA